MLSKGHVEKPDTQHHYKLSLRYDGITPERMKQYVLEMNDSDWVSRLEPVDGAVEYVHKLVNEHGYKFVVVTALSETRAAAKQREINLDNIFGKDIFLHDQMICLAPGSCKRATLSKWKDSNLFWIEDHPGHAVSGHELGLRSILIDDPHNMNVVIEGFPRVKTWEEIYSIITSSHE